MRASAAKRLKKSSSGPKTIEGRMIVAAGVRRQHLLLALSFRARIMRGRVRVGADGRDMDHPGADGAGRARHRLRAFGMHRVEFLPPALEQNADEVDHHVGVAHGRRDRFRVAQVGLHGMDLADPAQRLQMPGRARAGAPRRGCGSPVGQRPHHVAAEEA